MRSRQLATLQSTIIENVRAAGGLTYRDVAVAAGVNASTINRWKDGEQAMRVPELVALVEEGRARGVAPADVLGPIAAMVGAEVRAVVPSDGNPLLAAFDAADLVTEVQRRVAAMQADGRASADEAHDVHASAESAIRMLRNVQGRALRAVRA